EIGWGVLMVIAGLRPIAGRALMAVLGGIAVAGGALIVLDAWPQRLHDELGVHDRNGWLFLAAGAITLLAGLVLPVVSTPGQRTVPQRRVASSCPAHVRMPGVARARRLARPSCRAERSSVGDYRDARSRVRSSMRFI